MVVLNYISGSYVLNEMWWPDHAMNSPNYFIFLPGTEEGCIPWIPLHLDGTM